MVAAPPKPAERNLRGLRFAGLTLLAATHFAGAGKPEAQTSHSLGSHWGALTFPSFQRGWQGGLSFLTFTEYDSEGRKYGVTPRDSGETLPDPSPETVGFNVFSLAYANHLNPEATELANMMYRYGASFGINGDLLTEHYQNEIIHRAYRDFPPVRRAGVRCDEDFGLKCLDYSLNGEILYRFTNLELEERLRFSASQFFSGAGLSLSSVALDGYLQFGLAEFPTLVRTPWFSLRVASIARIGGILKDPFSDHFGKPMFRNLAPGYYLVQGGLQTRFGEKVYPILIGNYFTYHSGFWTDDRGRPIPTQFWTLTIDIDQLYFETFNDMLGGTDFGPTFGVRAYWDFEGRSRFFKALERFVKGLNRT